MRITEVERFKVDQPPLGLYADKGRVFFSAEDSSRLFSVDEKTGTKEEIYDTEMKNSVVTRYGEDVFFLDPMTRTVFKQMEDGKKEKFLDLNSLDLSMTHPALASKDAEVTDIFVRGNILYCVVKAGFGSGVYEINTKKGAVVRFFHSNGPEPMGVAWDEKSKKIYVADASQGYLVEFTAKGKHDGNAAKLPTNAPHGLAIDEEENFFVGARDTGEVVKFRIEED